MRKRMLFVFCLFFVLVVVPLNVSASSIVGTYMSTVSSEQVVGNTFYVEFKASFSGLERGSVNTEGVYTVAFEVDFDDSILDITGISTDGYNSTVYKDDGKYYILSIVDDSTGNKCVDNFLSCTNYSAKLQFYVKRTDKETTNIKLTEFGAGVFKIDTTLESYIVDNMKELEFISNTVQTIKLKQSDQNIVEQSKSTIVEDKKPEIRNDTIASSKANSNTSSTINSNAGSDNLENDSNTVEKSSNVYLKSVNIENYDIEFKRDKFYYNIVVLDDVNSLKVNVETEDSKSSYEIIGADNLKEHNNKIKILVTAEDGDKKTYTINIKRELEEDASKLNDKDFNKTINKLNQVVIIVVVIVIFITILVGIISHHNKRKLKRIIDDGKY